MSHFQSTAVFELFPHHMQLYLIISQESTVMLVEVENCQNVVPSIKETLKHARRKSSDRCWMGICFRHLLVGVLARC